jgi:hypothetical protein
VRTFIVLTLLGAFVTPTAAQRVPTPPSDAPYQSTVPDRSESLVGALHRADQKLEIVNRGAHLEEQNYGANGRINATRDAAIEADTPRAVQNGYSPWSHW